MGDHQKCLANERSATMVLGMSLQTFTLIHVLVSLAGIASGIVVLYGFLTNKRAG